MGRLGGRMAELPGGWSGQPAGCGAAWGGPRWQACARGRVRGRRRAAGQALAVGWIAPLRLEAGFGPSAGAAAWVWRREGWLGQAGLDKSKQRSVDIKT
jgi:hypothetical protein